MQKAEMQKRAMLIVSVAGALLLPPATMLHAQTAPVTPQAQTSPAPAALTVADVQAFINNPGAYITGLPASGEALSQRIRQLLTIAAQNGQLAEMLAGLNTVGAIPGITPQQLSAIVAGANAAAADLAAAQNLDAQRAIQVAIAANPALSGAQQALALATPQTPGQDQAPATADLGPAGGLTAGAAPASSAIGGAGSATGGGAGGSSATSTGTNSAAAGGTGIASGTGSFSGATSSGSSRNNNGSSGSSSSGTVDTSPVTRI
jgi:hypothetical protein